MQQPCPTAAFLTPQKKIPCDRFFFVCGEVNSDAPHLLDVFYLLPQKKQTCDRFICVQGKCRHIALVVCLLCTPHRRKKHMITFSCVWSKCRNTALVRGVAGWSDGGQPSQVYLPPPDRWNTSRHWLDVYFLLPTEEKDKTMLGDKR